MVVTAERHTLLGALIVPDEQTWTLSGYDPAASGLRPVFAPVAASHLLLPDVLPPALADALEARLAELPRDVRIEKRALPLLGGRPVPEAVASLEGEGHDGGERVHADHRGHPVHGVHGDGDHHGDDGGHDGHNGHDHHDHHGGHGGHGGHGDMMAIVGEPSADGLVMEPIELRFGPLATPLPGGLAVDVTLDGDVVSESEVQALLAAVSQTDAVPSPPDLLAPVAWRIVVESAADRLDVAPWRVLAAVETERAASHLAWLRTFGRLLGWRSLVDRCTLALDGVPPLAHRLVAPDDEDGAADSTVLSTLGQAHRRTAGVAALVRRSRILRWRTAGVGRLEPDHVRHLGLKGPVARASGVSDDARNDHPLYAHLGFEPALHDGADAHARTLVRADEAREALRLAQSALREDADGGPLAAAPPSGELEGPRGPVRAERRATGWALTAPGASEAVRAAGDAMVGAEWSDALVALASFDLSPWRVGG